MRAAGILNVPAYIILERHASSDEVVFYSEELLRARQKDHVTVKIGINKTHGHGPELGYINRVEYGV